MNIRPFKIEEYFMVCQWWTTQGEEAPSLAMMPLESTFMVDVNGNPILAVTLYLTNSKEVCYVENLIGNPEYKTESRKLAAAKLQEFIEQFAKDRGYRHLVCFGYKEKVKNRYVELGYKKTMDNISSFSKEIR
jgi:hypothetical protein